MEEKLDGLLKEYFSIEDTGISTAEPLESEAVKRAWKILKETTQRVGDRFQTGLLWRCDRVELPDSLPMAIRRLECLEKRMNRDPALKEEVHRQIQEYLDKGYTHRATETELISADPKRIWYLPLGVVQNPKKPGKVRLVWDAAAKVNGISLNDLLLPGPDMLLPLPSVLFRFRQFPVAVCGDIKQMFHQILVKETDRHSQRFLWRDKPKEPPSVYIMNVVTFGATSSPSSAQFIKNQNALEFADRFPRAAQAILKCHYVDDYLESFENIREAQEVSADVRFVHSKGGFEIRNWSSNSKAVLDYLGEKANATEKNLSPTTNNFERVLGMHWLPEYDMLSFPTSFSEDIMSLIHGNKRPTKRQILKCIMSLFDPLGLLASFLIHGKIVMQEVWRSGITWDEPVSDKIFSQWKRWTEKFADIKGIEIPRCYFRAANAELYRNLQAHVFVDASEEAYGAAVYFRIVKPDDSVQCTLVSAKTKVAPLKYVSIPRLELMAAAIGARLLTFVEKYHSVTITRRFLWSDSHTVLCWIRSEHRKYRQFVACRIGEILSLTKECEWRWVPSKSNVADEATKWGKGPCFDADSRWYVGPSFLYQAEDQWPTNKHTPVTTSEELRPCFVHAEIATPEPLVDVIRFSKWERLHRATAYVIKIGQLWKAKSVGGRINCERLEQQDLMEAEILLWKQAQLEAYPDEIVTLRHNEGLPIEKRRSLERSSPLYKLSPMLDKDGVLLIDGRINAVNLVPETIKSPIILPKGHRITFLVIDYYHRNHANAETVVNELRQRFYVPHLRTLVRKISTQCQMCKVYKARPEIPRMGPLPTGRLSPFVRPFSFVGLDYFGPLLVKVGRSNAKRWIAVFTCLTIRAVHVEVAYTLSTQSRIACIRRFVKRRGAPLEFYSDNGRNFVGAATILKKQIEEIHKESAATFTSTHTKWLFIPPAAPSMGGSWERMVRSIKTAMNSLPQNCKLDDEGLLTMVIEAEAIVNNRPLTYLPLDSEEQEALTPNHFILGSSSGLKQPMEPTDGVEVVRNSWHQIFVCLNHFWRRWVREYLPTLTRRNKWHDEVRALMSNDLVIVIDETKRNGWIRGRVLEVIAGQDGRVRQAVVQTSDGMYRRPVSKLAVLEVDENGKDDSITHPYEAGDVGNRA
ncbi:uncharacterized protein LOC128739603 [Sabethes cyaneus]|uniref:uncharacterized protein LOC128739603 n=1 Tax=Sabethes cyaneus TaxID=53552 RepID=UPI00237EE149|nr:uncharacterized protein LOC128739603 [Sabethes cyaneus]